MREENFNNTLNPYIIKPQELTPGDRLGYKVIAIIGFNNDWAAYFGRTDQSDDQIEQGGDKLNKLAAIALFPAIVKLGLIYRL
jgi:hypothetical protein